MATELELVRTFIDEHVDEAALTLERMPMEDARALLAEIPPATTGAVISRMAPHWGTECVKGMPVELAGEVLGAMALDVAAILLRRLQPGTRGSLLEAVPHSVADNLRLLLRYPENTAGAFMDPGVLALPADIDLGEALDRVRHSGSRVYYYVYVVGRGGSLIGVLNLREMMTASPETPIGHVMHRNVARLSVYADRIAIRAHPGWREYHGLPVVDDAGRLVGVVRYKTVRDVEEEFPSERHDPFGAGLALGEVYWSTLGHLIQALWPPAPTKSESEETDAR
jgi:magnesium transporter